MAGTSYTRQSTITDGNLITASLFNNEYNQLLNAFVYSSTGTTGHTHDGTAGQGGAIGKIGDQDFNNKIEISATNNRIECYIEVGGSPVEQLRIQDGAIVPVTDSDIDFGTTSLRFKDAFVDSLTVTGVVTATGFTIGSAVITEAELEILDGKTFLDEDDLSSDSATGIPSQQSVKAYVDAQVTAQDLDLTDGTTSISIDLDSEALSVLGGTGITSTASGNGVTLAIDSTVATLTGTQTLTNKTLTTPDVNTPDIDGGTIDGTVIGGTTAAAGSFTTVDATGNITVGGTVDGRDVAADGTKLDTVETNADVTDTTNVTAAGALMDSEVTNLAQVKAFDSADYATAAQGTTADAALPRTGGAMTGAITTNSTFDGRDVATDGSKLDGIEAGADVTDTANVTAAGALMDSELTSEASVKALNQGVATTDSPTFAAVTSTGEITANGGIALGDNDKAIFGAGSDLQIYHDGSNSYVKDAGNGDLIIQAYDDIKFQQSTDNAGLVTINTGGNVTIHSGNLDVTGDVNTSGLLKVGTNDTEYANNYIRFKPTGAAYIDHNTVGQAINFRLSNASSLDKTVMTLSSAGNVGIGTSSPIGKLSIEGGTATSEAAHITFANTAGAKVFAIGGGKSGVSNNGFSIINVTDNTAPLTVSDAGNVGIGVSNPSDYYTNFNDLVLGNTSTHSGMTIASGTSHDGTIAFADGTSGTAEYSGYVQYSHGTDSLSVGTSGAERMRIDSSGNVLVGTTSVGYGGVDLTVGDTTDAQNGVAIQTSTTGYGYLLFGDGSGAAAYRGQISYKHGDDFMAFNTANTERMRISSSGNVGIGGNGTGSGLGVYLNKGAVANFYEASDGTKTMITGTDAGNDYVKIGSLSAHPVGFVVGNGEKMRIDSSGNVGIGVAPAFPFHVQASDGALAQFSNGVDADCTIRTASGVTLITPSTGTLALGTSSTERMRIDSSGNLLVGTTNSSQSAGIGTKIKEWGSVMVVNDSSTGGGDAFSYYSTASNNYKFWVNANGQIAAISTSILSLSDQRFKENIRDLDDGLSKVMQLQPRKFDWKEGEGKNITNDRGFIAQEFEEVFPDLVDEWKDEAPEGEEPYKAVSADLIPTLVKAIQEQQTLIESLTARIAALEE